MKNSEKKVKYLNAINMKTVGISYSLSRPCDLYDFFTEYHFYSKQNTEHPEVQTSHSLANALRRGLLSPGHFLKPMMSIFQEGGRMPL